MSYGLRAVTCSPYCHAVTLGVALILGSPAEAARTWNPPVLLETSTNPAQSPLVAIDAEGNAIAIWTQQDGTYYWVGSSAYATVRLYANRYVPGVGWGTPAAITAPGVNVVVGPRLAIASSTGHAAAVWYQGRAGDTPTDVGVYVSQFTVDGGWNTPVQVAEGAFNVFAGWDVALSPSGRGLVHWSKTYNAYDGALYVAELPGPLAPLLLAVANGESISTAAVALDSAGNAVAAYAVSTGKKTCADLHARQRTAAGVWDANATIIDVGEGNPGDPAVAFDGDGVATVTWTQYDGPECYVGGTTNHVYARRVTAGGAWDEAEVISSSNAAGYSRVSASETSGDTVAVWLEVTQDDYVVVSARHAATGAWTAPEVIGQTRLSQSYYLNARVGVDGTGAAYATWFRYTSFSDPGDVVARTFVSGAWQAEQVIDSGPYGGFPQLAVNDTGAAIVAWAQQQPGSMSGQYDIYASVLGTEPACAGDCSGDRRVTVDELTKGINMTLGIAGSKNCPQFDVNRDGRVTVDELVTAVTVALTGCAS